MIAALLVASLAAQMLPGTEADAPTMAMNAAAPPPAVAAAPRPSQHRFTSMPLDADPHIHYVRFIENGVIRLVGFLGFQTTIQFDDGEQIENVAIGDSTSWQVTPNKRADMLFVKPITVGAPTNMIVVTNQRTYSFALAVAPPRTSNASAAWLVRFVIPALPVLLLPADPPIATALITKNASYSLAGPEAILPQQVFDDGKSTYFLWSADVAMPAIYAVNPDGSESVVNFSIRDGYAVVQQTAGRFVLRQGKSVGTVISTPGEQARLPRPSAKR